jgi:hypothetical protein
MSIHVEIPEPLAGQIQDAAKSRSTSAERYVLDAVSQTLAHDGPISASTETNVQDDPLLGLLEDDPELADFITESALERRRTLTMRAPRG